MEIHKTEPNQIKIKQNLLYKLSNPHKCELFNYSGNWNIIQYPCRLHLTVMLMFRLYESVGNIILMTCVQS